MNISDEKVEATAKALWEAMPYEDVPWENLPHDLLTVRNLKRQARIALETAAPSIAAQAWDEGYCAGWLDNENRRNTENPHWKDCAMNTPDKTAHHSAEKLIDYKKELVQEKRWSALLCFLIAASAAIAVIGNEGMWQAFNIFLAVAWAVFGIITIRRASRINRVHVATFHPIPDSTGGTR